MPTSRAGSGFERQGHLGAGGSEDPGHYCAQVTEDDFWALVERCRTGSRGNLGELVRLLERRVSALSPREILSFSDHWYAASDRALKWPVWDAACVLLGWVIDDSFADFRAWLISRGQVWFEAVVEDPDNLADLADELLATQWAVAEQLDGIARWVAYEAATGVFPPQDRADALDSRAPREERIDLADDRAVREHFPRLYELRQLARDEGAQ